MIITEKVRTNWRKIIKAGKALDRAAGVNPMRGSATGYFVRLWFWSARLGKLVAEWRSDGGERPAVRIRVLVATSGHDAGRWVVQGSRPTAGPSGMSSFKLDGIESAYDSHVDAIAAAADWIADHGV